MKYLSVCSGIEAASCAWESLGFKPVGFSEIEPFPSAVLAHRFPSVKNYGDMTKYKEWDDVGKFDVLVGGTPCQSFSVAGLRKGLSDPRGNLMLTFGAMADYFKPSWIVWENVPGVLSSHGGGDFGTFLGMLAELGYGFAYRVLDAQYHGVAQRRRRVFVVGYLGDWRPPAKVLFESESLCGNTPPSRKSGKESSANASIRSCYDMRGNGDGVTVPTITGDHAGRPTDYTPVIMSTGQGNAEISVGLRPTLNCNHEAPIIAIQDVREVEKKQNGKGWNDDGTAYTVDSMATQGVCTPINTQMALRGAETSNSKHEGIGIGFPGDPAFTFQAAHGHAIQISSTVRRLTPRECERLQGFPDDWTKIPWRGAKGEDCPDGPRYKVCGNSMAVPVMHWIGKRIKEQQEGMK